MLYCDSSMKQDSISKNINSITVDAVSSIQKEINSEDLISLVFLLYDVPDTALQRLFVFQRVSKEIGDTNVSLLHDWAIHAQHESTWRYEFLEALAICQLYKIIRKLGFDVTAVKVHFLPNDIFTSKYISPMKKCLYKLCEAITSDILVKIKKAIHSYDIDTSECDSCELIFLKLMCEKFIIVNQSSGDTKPVRRDTDIENLTNIIINIPKLKNFAKRMKELQQTLNQKLKTNGEGTSSLSSPTVTTETEESDQDKFKGNFEDMFGLLEELNVNDTAFQNLQSDTKRVDEDIYVINNVKRIGICYIINQENFHPSQRSIKNESLNVLDDRQGSTRDKLVLERTMRSFNFEIISHDNLECWKMIESIKNIVKYRVREEDSMFMLCILSHGYRGHVYAADSVEVSIDDIQKLLDSDDAEKLQDKPKILILQACQVIKDTSKPVLVADSPSFNYYLKKSDFLIYWATAPEFEAYRNDEKGSIFIQLLCGMLRKYGKHYHLSDLFTKVNNSVTYICTKLQRTQVPIFKSTLRKKLYLKVPT